VDVRIWGCRGSIATPGPDTIRHGGNTSCVEVRAGNGHVIVLDAGTGARPLGVDLVGDPPERIDLLLTHLHVDHLEGLGAFAPIWSPQTELHIWGPPSPVASLDERIAYYFSPPLFPVHLSQVPARVAFHDAPLRGADLGAFHVEAQTILHPGPTVGYRIEADGRVLAYLTDHEPALAADLDGVSPEWISGHAIADGADLLIHDCQYDEEEYPSHIGWGHSSTRQVATFARRAGVERLLLYHHDPMHGDDRLDTMGARVRELWSVDAERCGSAAEGMRVSL